MMQSKPNATNEFKRRNTIATRISTSREMKIIPDNRQEEGIFMQTQVDLEQLTVQQPSRNLNAKSAGTTRNLKYLQNYTSALPNNPRTVNKITFHTTVVPQNNEPLPGDSHNSLSRFIKARELAVQRSKERIYKLKTMLQAWNKKEAHLKEMQLDTIEEIKYKSQQRRAKMTQVKQKCDRFSKEREDQSIK